MLQYLCGVLPGSIFSGIPTEEQTQLPNISQHHSTPSALSGDQQVCPYVGHSEFLTTACRASLWGGCDATFFSCSFFFKYRSPGPIEVGM